MQKIRTQYTEKQHTELDALKELDTKVKRPANVFAYTYGSVSAIVMGAGMLLFMMVSLITSLGSTLLQIIGCLAGGILFSVGLGAISNKILNKSSLI